MSPKQAPNFYRKLSHYVVKRRIMQKYCNAKLTVQVSINAKQSTAGKILQNKRGVVGEAEV